MISITDAEEFEKEAEEKPVLYNVYCYYDKLTKIFNQPVITEQEPGMVVAGAKTACLKEPSARVKFKDLILVLLGTFNIKTGQFDLLENAKGLFDFDKLIAEIGGINPDGK